MNTINLKVPSMHCNHCVMHVKKALLSLDGVEDVNVDLETKAVEVEFSAPASDQTIREKLEEINYPAEQEG